MDATLSERDEWGRIEFRQAIVAWCLRQAKSALRRNDTEGSLGWSYLAAYSAGWDCISLASAEIESNLLRIAASIPTPPVKDSRGEKSPKRWLHVLSGAYPYGGHTAMVRRWIEMDCGCCSHSVVLLHQEIPVPDRLSAAVEQSGGEIMVMDEKASLLKKAEYLRNYAYGAADVVVLSISPNDVVPAVAFGVAGGPPVLLVNQAAQIFWVGTGMVDMVLNVRGSDLELEWTSKYRSMGPGRCLTLPIPLTHNGDGTAFHARSEERNERAKETIGLPPAAKMILTVGNSFKYNPIGGIDFLDAAFQIVSQTQDVYILAVGVDEDARWKEMYDKTGGRVRAVGRQLDMAPYHAAADLYMEGFPYGSTTAFLEAGLLGIPCVPAPGTCPPPFTSDGIAIDHLGRPGDIGEYVAEAVNFMRDDHRRNVCGSVVKQSIEAVHCGNGWMNYLDQVKQKIPKRHRIYPVDDPPEVPKNFGIYWSAFLSTLEKEDFLLNIFRQAWHLGLRPTVDKGLLRAMSAARRIRNVHTVLDVAIFLAGYLSRISPHLANRKSLIDKLYYFFRNDGKILRYLAKLGMHTSVRHRSQ